VYDGTPIVIGDQDYEIIEGGEGLTLDIDFIMDMSDAGIVMLEALNSDIGSYIKYTVHEGTRDVTDEYRIEFGVFDGMDEIAYIPIEITKRKLTLTAASATKIYDGEELRADGVDISFGSLAAGDTLSAYAKGTITEVGTAVNAISKYSIVNSRFRDVAKNYDITFVEGTLTVLENEEP
jgi:hypothetical protein